MLHSGIRKATSPIWKTFFVPQTPKACLHSGTKHSILTNFKEEHLLLARGECNKREPSMDTTNKTNALINLGYVSH